MLKRFIFVGLFVFVMVSIISAQSGRRVKTAPTPMNSTNTTEQVPKEIGYSESSGSESIPIFAKSRRDNKSKNEKKSKNQKTKSTQKDVESLEGEEIVSIESSLVTIPVTVLNRNGIYVPGLEQENFKIFENGVEQEVAYFGTADKPFTVIMLIDISPSALYKIEEIHAAAQSFVDLLKPEDSVMVISFDQRVNVLTEPTKDRQRIYRAINRANFGNGTSLYDAVALSLGKRLERIEGRKAVLLFTDGVDTTSLRNNYNSTLRDADEADALIFPIYYNTFLSVRGIGGSDGPMTSTPSIGIPGMGGQLPQGTRSEDYVTGRQYLNDLATLTGGRVFRPDEIPGGLTAAFQGVAEELRRQYNIGYYPAAIGEQGERKQIKVRVNRPNLIIRARDSYIVGSNTQ